MRRPAALTPDQQSLACEQYRDGKSMNEVAEYFGVSIDAVVYTLRKHEIARRSAAETNRIHFERKAPSFFLKKILGPEEQELKIAGIMLYWAEGYKVSSCATDLANSDPALMMLYMRFLREVCGIDERKIRCSLYCFSNQEIAGLTRFWSNVLCVPTSQFTKPYVREAVWSPRGNRMKHGLVHVRYCDKKLLQQFLVWIDEYAALGVGTQVVNEVAL